MKKKVFILSITVLAVFIVASVNLYLAKTNFISSLRSLHLVNLQAITSESSTSETCRSVSSGSAVIISYRCDCPQGQRPSVKAVTYVCKGSDGGECKPGNSYQYLNCDGDVTHTDDFSRSIAHCPR
jgi:hypothetical protein